MAIRAHHFWYGQVNRPRCGWKYSSRYRAMPLRLIARMCIRKKTMMPRPQGKLTFRVGSMAPGMTSVPPENSHTRFAPCSGRPVHSLTAWKISPVGTRPTRLLVQMKRKIVPMNGRNRRPSTGPSVPSTTSRRNSTRVSSSAWTRPGTSLGRRAARPSRIASPTTTSTVMKNVSYE